MDCDATIPSFSGGNDAQDSRVDWAAGRGHRLGTRRLDCDWCHGRSTYLHHVRPGHSHDWRNGHQRGQLRSAEQRQLRRPQHGPDECKPGELRHLAAGGGATTTYSNTPIQISFLPQSYGGTSISSDAPVVVSGVLNGVVNGPSSSTVTATLNPPPSGLFSLGGNWHGRVQPADQHAPAGSLDLQQRHDLRAGTGHVQPVGVSGSRTKHDRPVPDDRGRAWPAPLRSVPSPSSQGLKFIASGPF